MAFRRGLLQMIVFILAVAGVLTASAVWFYTRSNSLMEEEAKLDLRTYATVAAMQFTAEELHTIDSSADTDTALFKMLVERAERLRASLREVEYVYVMRKTEDPRLLAFVIENDMLQTEAEQDENHNGVIEPSEEVPSPGDPFDISGVLALQGPAFLGAATDTEPTHDQWGSWMSGYAPIRDATGNVVAVAGVDMRIDRFLAFKQQIFSPVVLGLVLLGLCLVAGGSMAFVWRRQLAILRGIDETRRAMVMIAQHKLGGPTATVRWWLELLTGDVLHSRKEVAHARVELQGAAERLTEVMRHLGDALEVESGDPGLQHRLAAETAQEIQKVGKDQ